MALPDNSQDYTDVSQGIDRITEILKQQSTPRAYPSLQPQAINLPDNIINMISGQSMAFGANHPGSNFAKGVQDYVHTQQYDQNTQHQNLINAFEAKLKMGDARTKALDDKIAIFTGNDPEGKALFLQELHNDPEAIDPTNSFQIMTKLAGIAKRTGYVSPDLQLDRASKEADIAFKRAQAGKMSRDSASEQITYEGAQQPTSTMPSTTGAATPPSVPATSPTAGVKLLLQGGMPYTKGLKEGYRWGQTADGKLVPVEMAAYTQDGTQKTTPSSQMSTSINDMKQAYDELHAMGADISTENKFLNNKINQALLSEGPNILGLQLPGGQTLMKGTAQQAIVDRIGSGISGMLLDIKSASGAGAKQFDSDADVKFMKQQASSPTNDYQANLIILDRISRKYTGKPLDGYTPQSSTVAPSSSGGWSVKRVK